MENDVKRIDAAEAKRLMEKENQCYENDCERFSNITDKNINEFEDYLFNKVYFYAETGHGTFEFSLNTDLEHAYPKLLNTFEEKGYKIYFYPLISSQNKKFNLIISW